MFSRTKDSTEAASTPAQVRRPMKAAPSIISMDMTVSGSLTAGGDIQVDGKVDGDITSGSLTIGEKAVVNGEILAEEVVVRGKIVGSIRARKVQLCSTCHVEGDIYHQALAVETGAYFEGNCRHSDDPLKESAPPASRRVSSPPASEQRRPGQGPAPRPDHAPTAPPPANGNGNGDAAAATLTPASLMGPRIPGSLTGRPAPMLSRPQAKPEKLDKKAEAAVPNSKAK
jgi:cytoskeletal protein CcmA (bactofilin family)